MKILILLFLSLSIAPLAISQASLPDEYQEVDQLLWIVADMERTVNGWAALGFTAFTRLDTISAKSALAEAEFKVLISKANLGGVQITWIQPLEENSVFAKFSRDYGDGVMSLVHRFGVDVSNEEIERLKKGGIEILDKITFRTPKGDIDYVLMDTRKKGKYILGITSSGSDLKYFESVTDGNLHHLKVVQYAFAIKELSSVSEFWQKVSFPPVEIQPSTLSNKEYHGEPSDFVIDLASQRHGSVPFEWVITRKPPTIHQDHIEKHGEGFHHLGFLVDDLEAVTNDFERKGIPISSQGTWGEVGKPGSGVFRYMDTEAFGGVILELLWAYKAP